MLESKTCPNCSKVFPPKERDQKFCGQSCANAFNLRGKPSHNRHNPDVNPERTCRACGKPVPWGNKFCNVACQWEAQLQELIAEVRATGAAPYSAVVLRRLLRRIYPEACSICGITEWMGQPAPLEVDHVDGDSTNNQITNLRLICGNCGMQLPTYKGRNRGKGRYIRMQRYHAGQSY